MIDHDYWLTPETTRQTADQLVTEVREWISDSDSRGVIVNHEHEARAVIAGREASTAIRSKWFFVSIGIMDGHDNSKETFYLSTAPNAYRFSNFNIVPWTNWLGDLVTRIRDALQRGNFPEELEYGPPNNRAKLPVGPLVNYEFRDGHLHSFEFRFGSATATAPPVPTPEAPTSTESPVPDETSPKPTFGLKDIIRTIDLDQNDRIRGPKSGIYLLTGGPGVGKTTVALHRIPFLINEQVEYDASGVRPEIARDELFFKETNMLVVVWKAHLVPYLRRCIEQLGIEDFPEENVSHVDRWIERTLRPYIRIGSSRGAVRIREEAESISAAKLSLAEFEIHSFLQTNFPLKSASAKSVAATIQHIRSTVEKAGYWTRHGFAALGYRFTITGINTLAEDCVRQLPEPERFGKYSEFVHRDLCDRIEQMRIAELDRVTRYVQILREFYASDLVAAHLASKYDENFVNEFRTAIQDQARARSISRTDMYFLLWIVLFITDGSTSRVAKQKPLPEFSHVMIDEAQYYHPMVLRLFYELAQLPDGTITIVGDLEQKITSRGGLVRWDDLELDIPTENIGRLVTNYRWSRRVFQFLQVYRRSAGIREKLKRPTQWYSGEGRTPSVRTLSDRSSELEMVAESISQLRDHDESSLWTIAVVVPDSQQDAARTELTKCLQSYGVNARWVDGEDVKESVDRVVVTNFDSIVGLEFDAVYVLATDEAIPDLAPEYVHSIWVALTRAKKYLHVSRVGTDAVFDRPEFDRFRGQRKRISKAK